MNCTINKCTRDSLVCTKNIDSSSSNSDHCIAKCVSCFCRGDEQHSKNNDGRHYLYCHARLICSHRI